VNWDFQVTRTDVSAVMRYLSGMDPLPPTTAPGFGANADKVVEYSYSTGDWKDQLTSTTTKTYNAGALVSTTASPAITYNADGNMTVMPGTSNTLTWQGNQLMSIGGVNASYTYDKNGLRTSKTTAAGTYTYYYHNGQLVRQEGPGGALRFVYDAAGKPWYMENGTDYFFEYNAQGDVVALLNSGGQRVVEYRYDAWGKILSITGSMAATLGVQNPFRYRGYVYDEETGWYYLKTRYYDPTLRRFISSDALMSTGQGLLGLNMYAYCNNNPANMSDSNGNIPGSLFNTREAAAKDADLYIGKLGNYSVTIYSVKVKVAVITWVPTYVPYVYKAVMTTKTVTKYKYTITKTAFPLTPAPAQSTSPPVADTPKSTKGAKITVGLIGIGAQGVAIWAGAGAAGLAVPTCGVSVPTLGAIAVVAQVVALVCDGIVLFLD